MLMNRSNNNSNEIGHPQRRWHFIQWNSHGIRMEFAWNKMNKMNGLREKNQMY